MGSTRRSVHFPPSETTAANSGIPEPAVVDVNTLLLYGKLRADHETVSGMLKRMPTDEDGLHGNVQVVVSTLRRMLQCAECLAGHAEVHHA